MRNFNNAIVKLNRECYLLNSDFAKAERLQLTDTSDIEVVEGEHYIYIVNSEYPKGKCLTFGTINEASHFYSQYTSTFSNKYCQYDYIEQGIQFYDNAFKLWYDKYEEVK